MHSGILAEFRSPEALLAALDRLRAQGYSRLETITPFPVEGLSERLEIPRSRVPVVALGGALFGGIGAYVLQWWCNVRDDPINVGGRPLHSIPAFVPITFEMTVLVCALTTVATLFALCGLPRLWHPTFEVEGIESASIDGYWLGVESNDPRLSPVQLEADLRAWGASRVVRLGSGT